MLNDAGDRSLASTQVAFAPADDILIGFDLDEHLVPHPDPDQVGNDPSDPKLCGHSYPHVAPDRLASIDLQGQFGRAIEKMHALLVELEPDLLVRCDGDVGRNAYVDDGPGQ
jgi:hypothetical protein